LAFQLSSSNKPLFKVLIENLTPPKEIMILKGVITHFLSRKKIEKIQKYKRIHMKKV
jgi:hypothetical protein